jgi:hypothetical protein
MFINNYKNLILMSMKKYINYLSFILLLLFFATSCQKTDTENLSKITYYPVIKMAGQPLIFIAQGAAYTDSGAIATENGNPLKVDINVIGDYFTYSGSQIDPTAANKYDITYSAKNKDGFAGTISREVYVVGTGDFVTGIDGLYISTVVRNGVYSPQYTGLQYIMVRKSGADTYEFSDAIGAYYDLGRGYGAGYRATGVTATAINIPGSSFTFSPAVPVGLFGGNVSMVSITVLPAIKTIVTKTIWDAGYTFIDSLKQVDIHTLKK